MGQDLPSPTQAPYALSCRGAVFVKNPDISFIVIGIDVVFVMQSLGELATLYPTPGAFTELAGRFIDPAIAVAISRLLILKFWLYDCRC